MIELLHTLIIAIAIVSAAWISRSGNERMAKIESRLDALEGSVVRIETKIDNFISSLAAAGGQSAQQTTPASSR